MLPDETQEFACVRGDYGTATVYKTDGYYYWCCDCGACGKHKRQADAVIAEAELHTQGRHTHV